jgi:hypothetical protein
MKKNWYTIHYLLHQKEPKLSLIKSCSKFNQKTGEGFTPLMIALQNHHITFEIIKFLIEQGATLKNKYLFLALQNEGTDKNKIISLLLDYGLTLTKTDKKFIKDSELYIDPIEREMIECIKEKTKKSEQEISLFVKLYFIDERLVQLFFTM